MGIFSDNCDRLWAAGLPVMPLRKNEKRPFLPAWQEWQAKLPSPPEREAWKRMHADGNIGLVLGPQSRMFALDIDTDDERVHALIAQIAPPSPWRRVGKKGAVLAFRYSNQPIVRVRYKRAEDGKAQTLIDMLGAGSQVVLPPSIHPDTMKPYWATTDLADVIDELPLLPATFERMLREGLLDLGYDLIGSAKDGKTFGAMSEFISLGNRDNALIGHAGINARDVMRGYRTLKQALRQMEAVVTGLMEKTYGDNPDTGKGQAKLLEFIRKDMSGPMGRPLPIGWDDDLTPEELTALGFGADAVGEDDVVWEPDEIRQWFLKEVSVAGVKEDAEAFLELAKVCISRIARNPLMDPIEQESLLKFIVDLSGKQVSLSGVRKQLNRMRAGPVEGLSHAQIAEAAVAKIEEIGGEIRAWSEKLWQWKGSHWEEMDEKDVMKFVITEYGDLKAAVRNSDHNGILKTIKSLKAGELCQRTGVNGINFVNGYLRDDMVLVEHDPDYGATYCLPYGYEPEKADKCIKFNQMLVDFWGEDEDYGDKVECLAEMLCMTLFGMMTQVQVAVCLYGVAQSGKSRIINILESLLPKDVVTSVPPSSWGERFSVVHLVGKLLNVAGELSEKNLIDGVRFKTVVSGETIDAEEKNKPKFNFKPKAAHWFSSNYLPKSADSSEGFTRRWIFLVFGKKVNLDKVIRDFEKQIIVEEREAIVAWAVSRMERMRQNNFRITDPISSMAQRASLENELNTVRAFLHDFQENGRMLLGVEDHKNAKMVSGEDDGQETGGPASALARASRKSAGHDPHTNTSTPFDTLYHAYRSYCVAQSVSPVSSKVMMKRMEMLQGTFGFKPGKLKNPAGLFIPVYQYITLVDPQKMKVSRVA